MSFLDALRHRLYVLRHREAYADEQAREARFHLELNMQEQAAHATGQLDAERAARRAFGSMTRYLEEAREMSPLNWLDRIRQDVAYAWRGARRAPGVVVAVVLTLGLGVGMNGAVFAVLDRVFARPPSGVAAPNDVRRLYLESRQPPLKETNVRGWMGYLEYRTLAHVFGSLPVATFTSGDSVTIDAPTEVTARRAHVSANFFSVLGVRLRLGRPFTDDEGRPDVPTHVAVISEQLWRRVFAGDPEVIGRSIRIDGDSFTVIGVAHDFYGINLDRVDVWTPLGMIPTPPVDGKRWYEPGGFAYIFLAVARIPSGTNVSAIESAAAAELNATIQGNHEIVSRVIDRHIIETVEAPNDKTDVSVSLRIAAVAVIVFLIACANVANLLLLRGGMRGREIAIRRALGVSRRRLAGQVFVESLFVALLAAGAALVVAYMGGTLLRRLLFPSIHWAGGVVDFRLMAFIAVAAVAAGILSGVAPAMAAADPDMMSLLRRGPQDLGKGGARLRSALVVVQTALCVVLIAGATLFVRSLRNVEAIGVGYDLSEVAFASRIGGIHEAKDSLLTVSRRFAEIAATMRAYPGVRSTAVAAMAPLRGTMGMRVFRQGSDSAIKLDGTFPIFSAVSRDFFSTAGVALVEGRTFTDEDFSEPNPVIVVDRRMASQLWPGRSPLGACLVLREETAPCSRIVGVVEDVHVSAIVEKPYPRYYIPLTTFAAPAPSILIRATPRALPAALAELRGRVASAVGSRRRVYATTLAQIVEPQLRPWLVGAELFTGVGVLAIIVAAVGIYSVASYGMRMRTHEIGVRIALGARMADIFALAARSGLLTLLVGTAVGIAIALALARFVASLLYGVKPTDTATLVGAAVVLLLVGIGAALVPAWRASQIDPMQTLNSE